jgi:hypothetical protein
MVGRFAPVLVALVAVAATILPGSSLGADSPEKEDVDHAIKFRESVGLRAGRSFVEATYQDRLSMEEAADMKARVKVQNSLGDAQDYARGRDSYGGVYVDQQRGGLPVFLFTGDADRHKDDTRRVCRRASTSRRDPSTGRGTSWSRRSTG